MIVGHTAQLFGCCKYFCTQHIATNMSIQHNQWRNSFVEFTLAVSARVMPVTHRTLLARAPETGLFPESR